jgi:hypothetical protein
LIENNRSILRISGPRPGLIILKYSTVQSSGVKTSGES